MNKVFTPPKLSPALAALNSAASALRALRPGGELEFVHEPEAAPWPSAATLHLSAGGYLWRLEAASVDFLAETELMAGLNPSELPPEFLTAALALFFQARLSRLSEALGWEIQTLAPQPEGGSGERLSFILNFAMSGRSHRLPLRLMAENEAATLALAGKLAAFPAWRNPQSAGWPVQALLLAGRMTLPVADLEALAIADILLPPEYPATDGRLSLTFNGGGFEVAVQSGQAHVIARTHSEVPTVSDPQQRSPDPAAESRAAPEAVIHFELGKKLLPWGELEALAPGRSFPLDVDPLGPVTLTLNGRALAKGRLVDMGGLLGVEITRLLEQ